MFFLFNFADGRDRIDCIENAELSKHIAIGLKFQEGNFFKDSRNEFKYVLDFDSLCYISLIGVGYSFIQEYLNEQRNEELLDSAIYYYEKGVKFYPDSSNIWENIGYARMLKGDFAGAELSYLNALESGGDSLSIFSVLFNIYMELKQYKKAIAVFEKIVRIDSSDENLFNLAKLYINESINDRADSILTYLTGKNDNLEYFDLWVKLPCMEKDTEKFFQRVEYIEKKGLMLPYETQKIIYENLAKHFGIDSALAYIERYCELINTSEIWKFYGDELLKRKDYEKCVFAFKKSININFNRENYYKYGVCLFNSSKKDSAMIVFDSLLNFADSVVFDVYIYLVDIYLEKNILNKAEEILKRGLKIDYKNAYLHFLKGKLKEKQKRYYEAIEEFEIASNDSSLFDLSKKEIQRMKQWIARESAIKKKLENE